MRKLVLLFIILLVSCSRIPFELPMGKFSYKLIMNGTKLGTAVTSTIIHEGAYITNTVMTLEIGDVKNITNQTIKETLDFKPIRFESIHSVIVDDNVQEISWIANFDGNKIMLQMGDTLIEFEPDEPFRLEGGFILNELITQRFRKNSVVSTKIYDPTLEPEDLIPVQVKFVGMKNIEINNRTHRVFHLVQAIENFKNIDIYLDSRGVVKKSVMIMLNNRIELILDPKHYRRVR